MAYRIVKEYLKYSRAKYRVETNDGLIGLRKKLGLWKICKTEVVESYGVFTVDAVFNSLEEAEKFVETKTDHVVTTEIVAVYN